MTYPYIYKRYCNHCDYVNKFYAMEVVDGELMCVSCGEEFKVDIKQSEKEREWLTTTKHST